MVFQRTKALTAFLRQVREESQIRPKIIHMDKDTAEINSALTIFPDARILLCLWHVKGVFHHADMN